MKTKGAAIAVPVAALICLWSGAAGAVDLTLSWDAPQAGEEVDGYYIYYDTDQSGAPYDGDDANEGPSPFHIVRANLEDPNAPQIQMTGLRSCQVYYFAITAYNSAGESDFSGEVSLVPVAKPSDVVVSAGAAGTLDVAWRTLPADDDGSIGGTRVYYDTDSGEPYEAPGSPVTVQGESTSLGPLQAGTTYYVLVENYCESSAEVGAAEETVGTVSGGGGMDAGVPMDTGGGQDASMPDTGATDVGGVDTGGEMDTGAVGDVGGGGQDVAQDTGAGLDSGDSTPDIPDADNGSGEQPETPGPNNGETGASSTSEDACACASVAPGRGNHGVMLLLLVGLLTVGLRRL